MKGLKLTLIALGLIVTANVSASTGPKNNGFELKTVQLTATQKKAIMSRMHAIAEKKGLVNKVEPTRLQMQPQKFTK